MFTKCGEGWLKDDGDRRARLYWVLGVKFCAFDIISRYISVSLQDRWPDNGDIANNLE